MSHASIHVFILKALDVPYNWALATGKIYQCERMIKHHLISFLMSHLVNEVVQGCFINVSIVVLLLFTSMTLTMFLNLWTDDLTRCFVSRASADGSFFIIIFLNIFFLV